MTWTQIIKKKCWWNSWRDDWTSYFRETEVSIGAMRPGHLEEVRRQIKVWFNVWFYDSINETTAGSIRYDASLNNKPCHHYSQLSAQIATDYSM
jgi:hypothetical protein